MNDNTVTDVQGTWLQLQVEAARAALLRGPRRRIARLTQRLLEHPDVSLHAKRTVILPFAIRWKLLDGHGTDA